MVPQDRFHRRDQVVVPHEPQATPPANWQRAPVALPPTPPVIWHSGAGGNRRAESREGRRNWIRGDRRLARPDEAGRDPGAAAQSAPSPVTQAAPVLSTQPAPGATVAPPAPRPGVITTAPPMIVGGARDERRRIEPRAVFEDGRRQRYQQRVESGGAVTVIGSPAPPPVARGVDRSAIEAAAAMRARQQARQAQQQTQQMRPAPVAVAPPPPRALPVVSPPPVSAPAPARREAPAAQPRHTENNARRGVPRQMER